MSSKFEVRSLKFKTKELRPKVKILVVCLFAAFAIAACSNSTAKRAEFSIKESKSYEATLFRQNCAICHGREGNGKEMSDKLIPSLRYGAAAQKSEEELYQQIKEGKRPMPAFKSQLSEEEMRNMARFIRRDLQGKQENVETR